MKYHLLQFSVLEEDLLDPAYRFGWRDLPPSRLRFGCGLLFQSGGLWIGAHYSSACRRWCINLLPCLTLWVALPGGQTP